MLNPGPYLRRSSKHILTTSAKISCTVADCIANKARQSLLARYFIPITDFEIVINLVRPKIVSITINRA